MDDIMNTINGILSDENARNNLLEMAKSLGLVDNDNTQEKEVNNPTNSTNDLSSMLNSLSQNNNTTSQPNNDISGLLSSLMSNNTSSSQSTQASTNEAPPFDMSKLLVLGQIISNSQKNDKNTDLFLAIKPLLKPEKQEKVDKVIKIFKLVSLWPAIKESGLLGGDLFGLL